ncbi:hypothetical protein CDL15_Pgr006175 [Punica granatum]|uniref:Uncharacterized protein n=1 Tax=Punica granatum TaxID=22663 RepID=A0A218VUA1_PUNGR|nr:hypothetical protein CDL15_Pgr006175 [Punica granatum]
MRCCCSRIPPDDAGANKHGTAGGETPQLLKIAVSGVTELLRILSPFSKRSLGQESFEQIDEISVSGIDDIVSILESDYEKAYFVTGRDLYQRNLKLLVPFFDQPSIELTNIEKVVHFYICISSLILRCLQNYGRDPFCQVIACKGWLILPVKL